MEWEEINPNEWKQWRPTNKGEMIEGKLITKKFDVGVNKSRIYNIETKEGVISIWGSVILDDRMDMIGVGDFVKISYEGQTEPKKGQRPAKIFKVERGKQ